MTRSKARQPEAPLLGGDDLVSWCAATGDAFAFRTALKRFDAESWPDACTRLSEMLGGAEVRSRPAPAGLRADRDWRADLLMRRLKMDLLEQENVIRRAR